MSRLMSVALTEQAVRERRKTVTRRLGWTFLKPGDTLTLCRKVQGRKADEPLVRLAEVEVVDVRRVPLYGIDDEDIAREGFQHVGADAPADPRREPRPILRSHGARESEVMGTMSHAHRMAVSLMPLCRAPKPVQWNRVV